MLGHLKRGVSIREAQSDFTVIANRLAKVYPKDYPKHFNVHLESLTNLVVGQFKTTLYIVLAAVGLLLLIGCANVANQLLARGTAREKEFAIRAALGAGRWRVVRQLLVESLLLALGGAVLGALLAWGGLKALVALIPAQIIPAEAVIRDRKSTRLNSSHGYISYAVFCLKKKKHYIPLKVQIRGLASHR